MVVVNPPDAFDNVQSVAVRMPDAVEPGWFERLEEDEDA